MGGDFTSDGYSTGRPYGDESHGTHCAGLAAAPINDEGVVGAAPGVSLVPLKIATGQRNTARNWIVDEEGFLDAMYYSIDNDIDVLSASWGLSWWYGNISLLDQAFEDAIDDGRNGKGIIIVFSSGNNGSNWNSNDVVSYRDEVITVGGTNPLDQRWPGSSYSTTGTIVDIAAPTGWAESDGVSNYTTDIEDSDGETTGDWTTYFGGTSGATPIVAGAAALLLSMDNQLTHQEVKDLLYGNAEKVGGYSYTYPGSVSRELGHGRLNTYKALKDVMPYQYAGQSFTSSTTLPDLSRIEGSTSVSSGVTLTISSGDLTIIEGNLNGSGSTIAVNGRLIIEEPSELNDITIDVSSGGELILHKGAELLFGSGQGITSYGKVTMGSTPGTGNVFLGPSGGSPWAGLTLSGSGATGSSLNNATIHGSANGVQVIGADSVQIVRSLIEYHQNTGLYVSGATGTYIERSTFGQNTGDGLFSDFSDITFGIYNRFEDNTGNGIAAEGSSYLEFGDVGNPSGAVSRENLNGVYANMLAYINLGEENSPYPDRGGNNSIFWNTGKQAKVENGGNIIGQLTWWGTSSPTSSLFEIDPPFGQIDWSHWLSYAPVSKAGHLADGDRAEASAPAYDHQQKAAYIWNQLRDAGTSYDQVLQTLMEHPEYREAASLIAVGVWLRRGNYGSSLALSSTLLKENLTSAEQRYVMRTRYMAGILHGDLTIAGEALAFLQTHEEEDRYRKLASLWPPEGERQTPPANREQTIAEQQELEVRQYPNPFNPVTHIQYKLPEQGKVSLKVFDILGRQVAELVNNVQDAGTHTVPFDAGQLSSGVYMYRLQTAFGTVTNTMLLVK